MTKTGVEVLTKRDKPLRMSENVATVFGVIQPIAQQLAQYGRTPGGRRAIGDHPY